MRIGNRTLAQGGRSVQVAIDDSIEWKSGGLTIDWSTVTAEASDDTLDDDTEVLAGDKVLPFGTILTKITSSGLYGPADTEAVDGRQTLTRGSIFILNETVVNQSGGAATSQHGVIEGGRVFAARVQAGATIGGATQPTLANVLTAMPRLVAVDD